MRAWLLRLRPVFFAATLVLLAVLLGQSEKSATKDRHDASAERQVLLARSNAQGEELRQQRGEIASLRDLLVGYQSDNEILRAQLQRAGIKPAVPRRVIPTSTTRPSPATTPTTRPAAGSGTTPPTTRPTTCQVCVMTTCVTTPRPICP